MINLHFCNSKVFVWNAEDAHILRKEHRIIGSLVGCYPSKTFQNETKWLPLQLLPEEAKLLINKGVAQIISIPEKIEDPKTIETFYSTRDKLFEEQIVLMKENRRKEILEKADTIYEGKKRKLLKTLETQKKVQKTDSSDSSSDQQHALVIDEDPICVDENSNSVIESQKNDENELKDNEKELMETKPTQESEAQIEKGVDLDKNAVIEAELSKVPDFGKEMCMIQLFTEFPWKSRTTVVNWKYPSTAAEKLRCAVFSDLWGKGYYITTATKFGGDFLAYEGDPLKYHALFIIVCVDATQRLQGSDIVIYGRLGHQVKKTVALASLNDDGEVDYISMKWEGDVL